MKKNKQPKSKPKPKPTSSSSSEEDGDLPLSAVTQKKKSKQPQSKPPSSSSEGEEENDLPPSSATQKKEIKQPKPKPTPASSSEEEEDGDLPLSAVTQKKKSKQPQSKPPSSTSEGEEENDLPPSSATQKKGQTVENERDSDGSDSDRPIAPESKSKPAVKRAIVLALSTEEDSRRSKKRKTVEGGSVKDEEGKKTASLFQRLWSDDDEIAILKGMLDYVEEKGANPSANYPAFLDFIKDSLHVEVETKQLVDKIHRLKKRYKNSLLKKKSFSPHEQTAFDLSSRIWGDNNQKSNVTTRTASKAEAEAGSPAAPLPGSSEGESWQFIGKACISMGLVDITVKAGLELCSQKIKAELEEKWNQLYRDECELFLRKLDLATQESSMITEALKKGK